MLRALTWIKGILGGRGKILLVVAAVTAAAGALWKFGHERYEAGYTAAAKKHTEALLKETERAVARARARWEEAAAAGERQIEREVEIKEVVRVLEKEVPVVVERVVPAECRDLGPDVQRLFNDAIRGVPHQGSDADDPAGAPGSVP